MSAPAPKLPDGKADLSGIWQVDDNRLQFNLMLDGPEVPMLPAAAALYKERLAGLGKDRPSGHCLPHSVPDAMIIPEPFKIVHNPSDFYSIRGIRPLDRFLRTGVRSQESSTNLVRLLIGRWEGDLVIESSGFNDKSWIDDDGYPHTDALHTTERFRRSDFGHMTTDHHR
jgi:hypothetical protein